MAVTCPQSFAAPPKGPGQAQVSLLLRLLAEEEEHLWLREVITWDLALWGEHIPEELLCALLATPEPVVCAAVLEVWRSLQLRRFLLS